MQFHQLNIDGDIPLEPILDKNEKQPQMQSQEDENYRESSIFYTYTEPRFSTMTTWEKIYKMQQISWECLPLCIGLFM